MPCLLNKSNLNLKKNQIISPLANLPTELLVIMYSRKYSILSPKIILENITLAFNTMNTMADKANPVPVVDEPLTLVPSPQTVIFSSSASIEPQQTIEENKSVIEIKDDDVVVDLKKSCEL